MPADGVQAQTVNGDSAPRVLCAGIIVLDKIGATKDPVKSASIAA
jgi:hypothetical protein